MNGDGPTWLSIETDRLIESETDDKADWNSPDSRRRAIERIETKISSTGGSVVDHRKLINACLAAGRLEHARQSINRAIDLYPDVGVFRLYRAILERNDEHPEATAEAYETGIDLL